MANQKDDLPVEKDASGQIVTVGGSFSGPLPPPSVLKQYEQVLPGLADRIVTMAENEEAQRHAQNQLALKAEIDLQKSALEAEQEAMRAEMKEARWGQVLAFCIGSLTIGAGAYLALHGAQISGTILGSGGVVGLVSVFIYGRKGKKETKRIEAPEEDTNLPEKH